MVGQYRKASPREPPAYEDRKNLESLIKVDGVILLTGSE